MATVQEALRCTADIPGDSPVRDVEILLGHCLGKPRAWLYTWPEHELDHATAGRFKALLQRRRAGEPVAYLVGRRDFWSLSMAVDASTLIPRPETETLVEWALALNLPDTAPVLDLGTGSGAIALALASERPGWDVTGVDASNGALALACRNARENHLQRVEFLVSDWYAAVADRRFGLVVSNPPYIEPGDTHLTQGDVRFEPPSALVAEEQGLADIRTIIESAPRHLQSGGWLLLEHGCDQGAAVRALLAERGFTGVATRRDLGSRERVTGGCWCAD